MFRFLKRLRRKKVRPPVIIPMVAKSNLRAGDIVYSDGSIFPKYSLKDRFVRHLGRKLRLRKLSHYKERLPIGIAYQSACQGKPVSVIVQGSTRVAASTRMSQEIPYTLGAIEVGGYSISLRRDSKAIHAG